ncbi:hypothetical protein AKJ41_01275 [candidate division MSBL1 archaeon SCGC-AAA259O05]|uniref:Uncharacterized protein n=1 Tax=candidate division MSBL1 archaeon SCGC-AAA259O05 TaxID=1698271 RepID=A0A133V4X5_9EURY|nr:hypothetical protein AKJ41_01275 [candidate division MSBL1 archaeon SCGC-AAA259O05]
MPELSLRGDRGPQVPLLQAIGASLKAGKPRSGSRIRPIPLTARSAEGSGTREASGAVVEVPASPLSPRARGSGEGPKDKAECLWRRSERGVRRAEPEDLRLGSRATVPVSRHIPLT